jgi:SAM-dependent methyltransferase
VVISDVEQSAPRGIPVRLWSTLISVLAASGSDLADLRLLDCGGGSGSLAVPMARLGARVTVVDSSIDALGTLTRRATEAGVADRVRGVQGEAEVLADLLAGETFDLVFAHEVLESVTSIDAVLAQIAGVLRVGGTVSVLAANPAAAVLGRVLAGDVIGALGQVEASNAGPFAAGGLTLDGLAAACRNAGLQPYEAEGVGVFADLVPGIELERPGTAEALRRLEDLTATRSPYRDVASRLHVLARRADP